MPGKLNRFLLVLVLSLFAGLATAEEQLDEHLRPLKNFVGKTWKGELKESAAKKLMINVERWERALNGRALRVVHSVNNGEYGGESLVFWDATKNSVVFYYFTTAGFYTHGTMTLENGKYVSHEYVKGNADGITEVKATAEITPAGELVTKSQMLKNGKWVDGHSAIYKEDPTAQVVFK